MTLLKWGDSSVGRTLHSHCRGRGFNSRSLHHFILALLIAVFVSPNLYAQDDFKEALYYEKIDGKNNLQCLLCPRQCVIAPKRRGFCGVRENRDGTLYTLVYAKPVSLHIDPIEKKPLFHFLPSTTAFSIATAGCNLKCKFCQNWEIAQVAPEDVQYLYIEPHDLVRKVKDSGSPTIAYTYSEPTIFYEYMLETAKLAHQEGIRNVMHSAGYINPEPLRNLCKYLDAANIDLKGFSDDFYAVMANGAKLEPILKTLKIIKEEGVHLEITNLLIPGYNDDPEMIKKVCLWIKENLGPDVPLHFSRFHPMHKLTNIISTPVETLEKARKIAMDAGLRYVYIGNVPGHPGESTYCPKCKKMLIERKGYFILQNNIEAGKCEFCGEEIKGVWR